MNTIVSSKEMAELERLTRDEIGISGRVLMEVAGRAVADVARAQLSKPGSFVVAVCGVGNNGGDGYVAARVLAAQGHCVQVFIFGDQARFKEEAKSAFTALSASDEVAIDFVSDTQQLNLFAATLRRADLIIDALFGTGLSTPVRGLAEQAIHHINAQRASVLSVDIASGVNADTGAVMGCAVRATHTVTFAFAKIGHYTHPGASLRGNFTIAEIGVPLSLAKRIGIRRRVLVPADLPELIAPRAAAAHKGNFGHALVFAGAPTTEGAALMALQGALRAGAGLVSLALSETAAQTHRHCPLEVMIRQRLPGESLLSYCESLTQFATSFVMGPGMGLTETSKELLSTLLSVARVPLCLDADALTLLAQEPALGTNIQAPLVITPHPKEMARLHGCSVEDVQNNRIQVAQHIAAKHRCTVVLKGAGTVIADAQGQVFVIDAGNPGMAKGGTGDVLAGIIGGLLAQGYSPTSAACAGALLHAAAGDEAARKLSQTAMIATDLLQAMGTVLAQWQR